MIMKQSSMTEREKSMEIFDGDPCIGSILPENNNSSQAGRRRTRSSLKNRVLISPQNKIPPELEFSVNQRNYNARDDDDETVFEGSDFRNGLINGMKGGNITDRDVAIEEDAPVNCSRAMSDQLGRSRHFFTRRSLISTLGISICLLTCILLLRWALSYPNTHPLPRMFNSGLNVGNLGRNKADFVEKSLLIVKNPELAKSEVKCDVLLGERRNKNEDIEKLGAPISEFVYTTGHYLSTLTRENTYQYENSLKSSDTRYVGIKEDGPSDIEDKPTELKNLGHAVTSDEVDLIIKLKRLENDLFAIMTRVSQLEALMGTDIGYSAEATTNYNPQKLAENILKLVELDYVEEPDYAMYDSGGYIYKDLTSHSFTGRYIHEHLTQYGAEVVIKPGTLPGQCWDMYGDSGIVTIGVRNPIVPKAITIDHTLQSFSEHGAFPSAPKRVSAWAVYNPVSLSAILKKKASADGYKGFPEASDKLPKVLRDPKTNDLIAIYLTDAIFDPSVSNRSTFGISLDENVYLKLRDEGYDLRSSLFSFFIFSNWGHKDYTCIYRIRIHGTNIS